MPSVVHQADFGEYAGAVARWEKVLGRPAPEPTEPSPRGKRRLAAKFVEWMMGQPEGRVTDPELGLSRTQQIKALGNGVVTQQAELALSRLFARISPRQVDSESRRGVQSTTQPGNDRREAMQITIDTAEALSPTEVEILEVLIGRKTLDHEDLHPVQPKPDTKDQNPLKEPDEPDQDETKPKKSPAKKAEPKDDGRSLDEVLNEAAEVAKEVMNQQGQGPVRLALARVDAPRVSAINNVDQASKFLSILQGTEPGGVNSDA